ncbi:hypothetical protein D3C76_1496400 [compost metagenome]
MEQSKSMTKYMAKLSGAPPPLPLVKPTMRLFSGRISIRDSRLNGARISLAASFFRLNRSRIQAPRIAGVNSNSIPYLKSSYRT